ncbi:MAG TPA: metalloregulator ArsR/SmtB family transcription factor [Anaerolineae bacterium]|nr:metalloregulator ArsR/SmtB family transcription factor [Anaerolineae bacterium]
MPSARSAFETEARLLALLAHPMRLQILELLRHGEVCVCDMQAALGRRQAYISQHLMALREAGLVTCRKEGLRVYYQLSEPRILRVLEQVHVVNQSRPNGHTREE